MQRKRILIVVNTSWNIVNFRSGLVLALIQQGYEVAVAAPEDKYSERILALGCRYIPVPMDNHGTSPVNDMLLMLRLFRLLQQEKPDVFLGYTAKPNIFGSLAAHALHIPVINNIAGLGTAFSSKTWITKTMKYLYWAAIRRSHVVFFQNSDDLQLFVDEKLVRPERCALLPGSGVDLERFKPTESTRDHVHAPGMRFLFVGRLLWEKGIAEYVEAAKLIKLQYPEVQFQVLGPTDDKNPGAVSQDTANEWTLDGSVEYLGSADDVRSTLASADCIVLPTYYREGTPRSLLEAAAMAKPIITTDWVGSRNVVDHGVNGYLCQTRSVEDLACKLRLMIQLPSHERSAMGSASRRKAVSEFDEQVVIERYTSVIQSALDVRTPRARGSGPSRHLEARSPALVEKLMSRRAE
jgi:glycosyltransferase involved in cell wall biosynthesis